MHLDPPTEEHPVAWFASGEAVTLDSNGQFRLLARAVREHQRSSAHPSVPTRPRDHRLYRLLAELEAVPG